MNSSGITHPGCHWHILRIDIQDIKIVNFGSPFPKIMNQSDQAEMELEKEKQDRYCQKTLTCKL